MRIIIRIIFLLGAWSITVVLFAAAPIDGWYTSIAGGFAYLPSNVTNNLNGLLRDKTSYDNGWNGDVSLAYQSYPIRYAAEVTYVSANLATFKINTLKQAQVSGSSTGTFIMLNAYYDFPPMVPSFAPFLGAGIGGGYITAKLNSAGPFFPGGPLILNQFNIHDTVFAYQLTGGITYNFSENYAVNIAYRYIETERASNFNRVFQAHLATAGAIFRFDEVSYR